MPEIITTPVVYTKAQYVDVVETEGARVYTFKASTGAVDRQGEIVDQSGWDLEAYRANPVVLDSHKYESVEDVIGRAVRVEVVNGVLEADIIFADTEKAECAEELVNTGFVRTVSVGFRSLERRPGNASQPLMHTKAELLEISLVAVPANKEAQRIRSMTEKQESGEPEEKDSAEPSDEVIGNNGGTVEKIGRSISSKNLKKLQTALDMISEVVASVGDSEMVEDGCGREKPKPKFQIPTDVEDALKRFVGGKQNG